jgi:hypothetical protein
LLSRSAKTATAKINDDMDNIDGYDANAAELYTFLGRFAMQIGNATMPVHVRPASGPNSTRPHLSKRGLDAGIAALLTVFDDCNYHSSGFFSRLFNSKLSVCMTTEARRDWLSKKFK